MKSRLFEKNLKKLFKIMSIAILLLLNPVQTMADSESNTWHVANKEELKDFFESVVSKTGKGVVVSKQAGRKQINGKFNIDDPIELVKRLSKEIGLIWYTDDNVIYIYDSSEIKNSLIFVQNLSITDLNNFLRETQIYDERYKIRGGEKGTFYVSGPPVYVDLVLNAAKMLDKNSDGIEIGRQKIGIIHLVNTFVTDRTYELRNEKITIPGISTIIAELLNVSMPQKTTEVTGISNDLDLGQVNKMPAFPEIFQDKLTKKKANSDLPTIFSNGDDLRITAYPGNNTILVKGTVSQVEFVTKLIKNLDVPKRHIELSLWIIDINKNELESLGVEWSGSINFGDDVSMSLNQTGTMSTLDGATFIANVHALEEKNKASVISRPVILTQENIPAIFDNNRSFYTKLIGERNSSLESVSYGTMISVLPRFGAPGQIELSLNIEDGSEDDSDVGKDSDNLPKVGRTVISTVARVPQGKSLLIGGYTKDTNITLNNRIPLLGSLPVIGGLFSYKSQTQDNIVRVFLIQPREVKEQQMRNTEVIPRDLNELKKQINGTNGLSEEFLNKWIDVYMNHK